MIYEDNLNVLIIKKNKKLDIEISSSNKIFNLVKNRKMFIVYEYINYVGY